jgi:hypothetical protein
VKQTDHQAGFGVVVFGDFPEVNADIVGFDVYLSDEQMFRSVDNSRYSQYHEVTD